MESYFNSHGCLDFSCLSIQIPATSNNLKAIESFYYKAAHNHNKIALTALYHEHRTSAIGSFELVYSEALVFNVMIVQNTVKDCILAV